jgi:hypothetical protein
MVMAGAYAGTTNLDNLLAQGFIPLLLPDE